VALAPSLPVLLAGAFLLGIGYGSLLPTGQTIAMTLLPPSQSGMAFSWYFLFVDLGFGLGPLLMGFLLDRSGTRTMILMSCTTVVLAGALFKTLLPQHARRGR
jgi:MFS family permease